MTLERVDLLVRGGAVVTMDPERRILSDGAVAIRDGFVIDVGKHTELRSAYAADHELGSTYSVVTPGLIDCHNHPIHYLSKGMVDDMRYPERWRDRVWPYEASLSAEEAYLASVGTFIEMIRGGTTCFSDPGNFQPDSVGRAAETVGIRGVISQLTSDVKDPSAPQFGGDPAEALAKAEDTVKRWKDRGNGLIRAWFSLVRGAHVTDSLATDIKDAADRLGVGIHAHLCTSRGEVEEALDRWNMTPVERYRRLGVLGPSTQLVHMGWISEADIDILVDHNVSVCHCPSASMFGGFGCIAYGKFPELVARKVRVVLGTDACAISRFVDMVRIMYLAACGHKDARTDPTVIGAHTAFEMATINAAEALLQQESIGSLEPGKRADLVVFDTDEPEWHPNPLANPVANLVYSGNGRSVRDVVIDGRPVMDNRRLTTVDEASFLPEAGKVASAIMERMNVQLQPPWPVG